MQSTSSKIAQETIDQIRANADIAEIVGRSVQLKQSGKDLVGLCPFHEEKTPSFTVTPDKGLYKCFGCGEGGSVIEFVKKISGKPFRDVVASLAAECGVEVKLEGGESFAKKPRQDLSDLLPHPKQPQPKKTATKDKKAEDRTVDDAYVAASCDRLFHQGEPQKLALAYLEGRKLGVEQIKHYRLGLEQVKIRSSNSGEWRSYWGVAIFVPVPEREGRYHKKVRVAPWLADADRPEYLPPWIQSGVPAAVFRTYSPLNAVNTYFVEGEWDALRLGWEAKQYSANTAIACSTSGCNSLPPADQLTALPGRVAIFFDRNDTLNKQGLRAGDEGAKKLCAALGDRGFIAKVPLLPEGCTVAGWDVSNALDAGFTWEHFQAAAKADEPMDFRDDGAKKEGSTNAKKDPDLVGNITVEEHICRILSLDGICTIDDTFYRYTDRGYWKKLENKQVLKLITDKLRTAYIVRETKDGQRVKHFPFFTDAKKKSTFQVCRDNLEMKEKPSNSHLRCFLNCTVDMRTGEATPHDKNHLLTTAIGSNYEPNQECPEVFLNFIKSAYGEDLVEVIRACTSMLLDPTAPYGKFIHLMGPSGSGKGTLLRLWGELFGLDHFRSGDFGNLGTAEGRHQYLTGAALYAVPDVGGYIQGLKAFYELVDNGPMSSRALFSSNASNILFYTRFVVASVNHLQIENSGDGWDRRVIALLSRIRAGAEDPTLGTRLAEAKGSIISWAISMSREDRDRIIMNAAATNERIQDHKHEAAIYGDPVRGFIDLCLRPSPVPGARLESHELHTWFTAFCKKSGYQPWGFSKFIAHLKTVLPSHYIGRRRLTAIEDPNRPLLAAYWSAISALPGVFIDTGNQGDCSNIEPDWICIKSKCQEGGLSLFKELTQNGSATSSGSVTLSGQEKVTDLHETTVNQGFQKNGSVGSVRSGEGVGSDQVDFVSAPKSEGRKELEGETKLSSPPPLPDLPDPGSASVTLSDVEADQSLGSASSEVPILPDLADPATGAAILIEHDIDSWEEIADLIEDWSENYQKQVWALLPMTLRQKFKKFKAEHQAPKTNNWVFVDLPKLGETLVKVVSVKQHMLTVSVPGSGTKQINQSQVLRTHNYTGD